MRWGEVTKIVECQIKYFPLWVVLIPHLIILVNPWLALGPLSKRVPQSNKKTLSSHDTTSTITISDSFF